MTYSKLTIDQKNELRERLFDECFHHECYDCTDFDNLSAEEQKIVYDCDFAEDIPDSVMESAYGMYDFVMDDFFCTAGMYELEEEPVLKISKIAIKTETFCTPWNGNLYCVDICEDAEERSAWIYNVNNSVKSLMWGEKITQQSREEFLDCVFSSLPSHIEYYAEEYED